MFYNLPYLYGTGCRSSSTIPALNKHPSVRDLAGTLSEPVWDAARQGIRLTLIPAGPAADILLSLRNAAKENPTILNTVGFSAVVHLEHDRKGKVTKIVRAPQC